MKWLGLLAGFIVGLVVQFNRDLREIFGSHVVHWTAIGFLLGWIWSLSRRLSGSDAPSQEQAVQSARVDAALGDIHWRLKRLEDAEHLAQSPLVAASAAATSGAEGALPKIVTDQASSQAMTEELPPSTVFKASLDPVMAEPIPQRAPHLKAISRAPDLMDKIKAWFLSGNTVAKVGAIILFFGVGFLIKYASDRGILPIELRLAAVTLAAIGTLIAGWKLRAKNALFGQILQGTAIGVLYLTIFGAFKLYHLLPAGMAFGLMLLIVGLSGLLAVKQNALWLAVIGASGGYLAPILTSTGGGSHVALFSYYSLLSVGILGIAWFKAWRVLNLLGFGFTFGIGALWGANAYQPEHFATTEPFLLLAIGFYITVAVLFARHVASPKEAAVDATIVFGTPIAGFGLQAALVKGIPFAAAFSAVALAAVYLLLAAWLKRRDAGLSEKRFELLAECFLALGVIFATLALPLALDGRWTSAAWALEGAAVIWVGVRQNRLLARLFGALVQVAGIVAFFGTLGDSHAAVPLLNANFLGLMLIALSALFTARVLESAHAGVSAPEQVAAIGFFVIGVLAWLVAGVAESRSLWTHHGIDEASLLAFFSLTAWLVHALGRKLVWPRLQTLIGGFLPLLILAAVHLAGGASLGHLWWGAGMVLWPVALVSHYLLLRRAEADGARLPAVLVRGLHPLGVWFLAAFVTLELLWLAHDTNLARTAWRSAAWVGGIVVLLNWLSSAFAGARWPVAAHRFSYLQTAAVPLVVLSWLWVFYANLSYRGADAATFYLPLVNVLDLAHVAVALSWVAWRKALTGAALELPGTRVQRLAAEGAAAFVWLNGMLLRSLHHWADVPYRWDDMLRSVLVQTSLSIFWTLLAFAMMWLAAKKVLRPLWFVGAALMAVVVAKLFLIDLSNIGGIERIVSFIGVGVLMLAIGYLAPLPTVKKIEESTV